MERTDTTGVELRPKGHYSLRIERVIKSSIGKEGGKQYPGYKWYFEVLNTDSGYEEKKFDMFMFKSQMGGLLAAIGAKEVTPGVYEWELDDAANKTIEAEMAHVDINGKMRDQLIEVVTGKPVEKAWDK